MLNPHVGVGVGLDVWWRTPLDTEATNTGTLFLQYYPSVRAGAFLEAGAGLSRASVQLPGDTVAQGRSWALMMAVGYDVRLLTKNSGQVKPGFGSPRSRNAARASRYRARMMRSAAGI